MLSENTLRAVAAHAGLRGDPLDPATVSGATGGGGEVAPAVDGLLRVLQEANVELNGSTPSESVTAQDDRVVPASLAYAVGEATRMLRAAGYADAAGDVDVAWLALLAGDVDDVVQEVRDERTARN